MPEEKTKIETPEETGKKKTKQKSTNPQPVKIFRKWCKACSICIELCPQDVFVADPDGYPVIEKPFECTQCGICWLHCPDFAITSTEK